MRTTDEVHVVFLEEARDDVGTEREGDATVILGPACDILVRIRPQQVAEKTAVGDLECKVSKSSAESNSYSTYISRPHDTADLLHRVQIRAQATVHGEDLLIDDGGNGQAVKAVGEGLPQLDVVATLAFVVEAVDAVDRRALVVTPQDEEVFRILDLVGQEQADGLE